MKRSPPQEFLEYPNDPQFLVNKKIEIFDGLILKGKVTRYNPSSQLFTVVLDSNEVREYDLFAKKIRIVSVMHKHFLFL